MCTITILHMTSRRNSPLKSHINTLMGAAASMETIIVMIMMLNIMAIRMHTEANVLTTGIRTGLPVQQRIIKIKNRRRTQTVTTRNKKMMHMGTIHVTMMHIMVTVVIMVIMHIHQRRIPLQTTLMMKIPSTNTPTATVTAIITM
mmetsp:Transcript_10805/g.19721  ORF Transcript_10805/g.19721 Transcript_10805/m.19721 type:complete len:145 (-) Transcript_10805:561-995(-)